MSKELTTEERISILLTIIFDEGVDKYQQNFQKLMDRLNQYYDTNKVDIINYFTKVIMNIPSKGTIYSNALYNLGKNDIINSVFKKLGEELNKSKNCFHFVRSFIFIFGLIHFGILSQESLNNFITENLTKKNINLIKIILYSIFLIFRKNNSEYPEYQFLSPIINAIYDSNLLPKEDIILKTLYEFNNNDINLENLSQNKFTGFFIKDIPPKENKNENNNNDDITMIDNIFNELNNINFGNILIPELCTRKYYNFKEINFLDIYYELFIMNNIEAFKDYPKEGIKTYLFNLPEIYYNITDKEKNNNIFPYQFILENFTYASLDLILFPVLSKGDLCYLVNYIIYTLSEKKVFFKKEIQENNEKKEENIYINFIKNLIKDNNFLQNLSPFQYNNLIFFLYHIISNISEAKIDILSTIQKIKTDTDNNTIDNKNYSLIYFINSFYEKISNIIKKSSLPNEITYFPEKDIIPIKIENVTNYEYFNDLSNFINEKRNFNTFNNKNIFINDETNEALYTFVYCILNSKDTNLSKIYDYIELYGQALRDMINNYNSSNNDNDINNEKINDKMKTILKVVFDVYGNLPLYYIYIIDLFAFKNLLNNIIIINFIFTEKLFQKKENGLIYCFYELINNCIENCYLMLNKFDNDFQNLANAFSKADENKRNEMQKQMDFYDKEVDKLKKQKNIICDKTLEMFIKMYEISEGLGGKEYKEFIKKIIKDEYNLFLSKYKVGDDWNEKINNLE